MKKKIIITGIVVVLIAIGTIMALMLRKGSEEEQEKTIATGIVLVDEKYTLKDEIIEYSAKVYNNTDKDKKVNLVEIRFIDKENQELLKYSKFVDHDLKPKKEMELTFKLKTKNIKDIKEIEREKLFKRKFYSYRIFK